MTAKITQRRFILDASMTRKGGGFSFVLEMVPKLVKAAPADRFRIYLRHRPLAEALPDLPNLEIKVLPECGIAERMRFIYFTAPGLAREWEADCYLSFGECAPIIKACPVIATFQNLNVFEPLEDVLSFKQKIRFGALKGLAWLATMTCDRVYFVSKTSAEAIGKTMGIAPEKRAAICHGINAAEWKPTQAYRPSSRRHILSVSSIYHYKNFVKLIEAYGELAERTPDIPDLVIVGDDQHPEYSEEMEAARLRCGEAAEQIHILGEVPYADVKSYYQTASLFVFPSYRESFGIPMVEAMASEVPVVASDMPVFHEIAGDAAVYFDPHNSSSLASAMESVLRSEETQQMLVKRGSERVKNFTWERTASEVKMLLHDTAGELRAPEAVFKPSEVLTAPSDTRQPDHDGLVRA